MPTVLFNGYCAYALLLSRVFVAFGEVDRPHPIHTGRHGICIPPCSCRSEFSTSFSDIHFPKGSNSKQAEHDYASQTKWIFISMYGIHRQLVYEFLAWIASTNHPHALFANNGRAQVSAGINTSPILLWICICISISLDRIHCLKV